MTCDIQKYRKDDLMVSVGLKLQENTKPDSFGMFF